jgi:uncharacterized membrane protein YdjX (TVP38/TMEM64 family)
MKRLNKFFLASFVGSTIITVMYWYLNSKLGKWSYLGLFAIIFIVSFLGMYFNRK